MIDEDLSWLGVFMDSPVEQADGVLRCAFIEYLRACHEATVVVQDCDGLSWAYEFEVALP